MSPMPPHRNAPTTTHGIGITPAARQPHCGLHGIVNDLAAARPTDPGLRAGVRRRQHSTVTS